ncbi:unnamed protein product [Cylindrotheca closterium]|uniref:Uncharacterized protein n=1 Tax=Cylindrotheca closterium TaxID=2856 RepID=A0AAD2PUX2_9STRA|nr:unnamed protein product [Cylindrotheca closterium]
MPGDDEKSLFDASGSKIVPCDSSAPGFRTSVRRRSSLFNTLPTGRSRSEKKSGICDNEQSQSQSHSTIVLESQMLSNTALELPSQDRQHKKRKSLFGAVMKRSDYLEPAADTIHRSPNTPAINKREVEESNLFDGIGDSVMSPTGKTIMGFVNNFGSSPFRFQSPKKMSLVHSEPKTASHVDHKQRFISKRGKYSGVAHNYLYSKRDDWLEIPMVGDQLACLDFSLRTTLLVECSNQLKFCLRSVLVQDNIQKHLKYWIFPHLPLGSLSTSLPLSIGHNARSGKISVRGSSKIDFSKNPTQETLEMSAADLNKRLTDLLKADALLYSTKHLGKSQRKIIATNLTSSMYPLRWQEATRSIFLNWCCSIKALSTTTTNTTRASNDTNTNKKETSMIANEIYFYCVAKDHVAMFRVDETVDDNMENKYEPRVILSNITADFQRKLEGEGVDEIQFLNDPKSEVAEGFSPRQKDSFAPMSPNVKAELEALRRAQVLGENAGADVRVKSDAKRAKISPASRAETPCSICGFDNVSCFFEVFLNSLGQMNSIQNQQPILPILVCDTMGPFLHSTLETLESRPVKTTGAQSLRLEGLIMPSAFRNVVASITREVTKIGSAPQPQRDVSEDREGTSYVLIETAINNESSPVSKQLEDSRAFNGWNKNEENQIIALKLVDLV